MEQTDTTTPLNSLTGQPVQPTPEGFVQPATVLEALEQVDALCQPETLTQGGWCDAKGCMCILGMVGKVCNGSPDALKMQCDLYNPIHLGVIKALYEALPEDFKSFKRNPTDMLMERKVWGFNDYHTTPERAFKPVKSLVAKAIQNAKEERRGPVTDAGDVTGVNHV